jgi:hypothetical protein
MRPDVKTLLGLMLRKILVLTAARRLRCRLKDMNDPLMCQPAVRQENPQQLHSPGALRGTRTFCCMARFDVVRSRLNTEDLFTGADTPPRG